jgi:hypothetical protein
VSDSSTLDRGARKRPMGLLAFLGTFLAAWAVLDRLVPSPPVVVGSLVAIAGAGAVLVVGETAFGHVPLRAVGRTLGLGRPRARALVAASIVGSAVLATFLAGAALTGVDLELRSNWPNVLIGVLLFHGVAEELVWRGFAFGRCRASAAFWPAIAWTIPLIALTHVPIILSNGAAIGGLAVTSAAVTCIPFAYLWERGGRAIWAPAVLHGMVDTWQLFERGYPDSFTAVVVLASIVVPLAVLLFGDRFFGGSLERRPVSTPAAPPELVTAAAGEG